MPRSLSIVLIEDNADDATLIMHRWPYRRDTITHVETIDEAKNLVDGGMDVSVFLLDLGLRDSHGLETLERFKESLPRHAVVVLTGLADLSTALDAIALGADQFLVKETSGSIKSYATVVHSAYQVFLLSKGGA